MNVRLDMHTGDAWDAMDYCTVELDQETVERIVLLSKTVQKLDAAHIADYDYRPEYFNEDGSEWDGRVDCVMLNVAKTGCYWFGYFKHTEQTWETETIPLDTIKEVQKIMTAEQEALPLLIGKLKTDKAKALLEERMRQ